MTPALKLVPAPPKPSRAKSVEASLKQNIKRLDVLEGDIAELKAEIVRAGRQFIRERYPNEREFLAPSIERLKRELKLK